MLDGAADAKREIEFGCDRLAGRANLALHGQPAVVADGTRSGKLTAERFGELLRHLQILLLLDAAAHGDDDLGLRKVHRLLGFLERFFRLRANHAIGDLRLHGLNRSGRCTLLHLVGAKRSGLEAGEPGTAAGDRNIGGELALEHLPNKQQLAVLVFESDAVGNQGDAERGGELGSKIPHLVGVRHEHEFGLALLDEILEGRGKSVGRVTGELFALDGVNLGDLFGRDFAGDSAEIIADDGGLDRPAGLRRNGLRSSKRLPGDAVQFAFTLFDDDQIVSISLPQGRRARERRR